MQSRVVVINAEGRPLAAFWDFCSWFWTVLYSLKIFSVLKMPVSLNQDRATVEVFNNRFFVCTSKCKNLFSVRHYLHFCLISCALHCSGKECTFFIIFSLLLSGAKFFSASSFITVVVNVWIASKLYVILISLSGDVQLHPGPKDKSSNASSICHWNQTEPVFQGRITIVSTLWINVEITFIRRWKWNKIRRLIFGVAQRWSNVGFRRWNSAKTSLIQLYLDTVSTWPQH